jgi:hypothetical protein
MSRKRFFENKFEKRQGSLASSLFKLKTKTPVKNSFD